nr:unnamed protein product [Callosobruchus analis]
MAHYDIVIHQLVGNDATRTEMPFNTLSFPQPRKTTAKASFSSTTFAVSTPNGLIGLEEKKPSLQTYNV